MARVPWIIVRLINKASLAWLGKRVIIGLQHLISHTKNVNNKEYPQSRWLSDPGPLPILLHHLKHLLDPLISPTDNWKASDNTGHSGNKDSRNCMAHYLDTLTLLLYV